MLKNRSIVPIQPRKAARDSRSVTRLLSAICLRVFGYGSAVMDLLTLAREEWAIEHVRPGQWLALISSSSIGDRLTYGGGV